MKKRLKAFIFTLSIFFFFTFLLINNYYIVSAKSYGDIPNIDTVVLENSPFIEGLPNALYISSKNFYGDVQYQLFYKRNDLSSDSIKLIDNDTTINGWTIPIKSNHLYRLDISNANLQSGSYKFYIRVKRAAMAGNFQSDYGSYDSEHSLTLLVTENLDVNEGISPLLDKVEYTNNEFITLGNPDNPLPSILYKLHLYNIKSKKWLPNLTDYVTGVNYSLFNVPPGTYLVDLWHKNLLSKNKYDGWQLSIININDENSSNYSSGSITSPQEPPRIQSTLQINLYEYLTDAANRESVKNRAFSLNGNHEKNSCVYFVSEALRRVNLNISDIVCNTGALYNDEKKGVSLTYDLLNRGWKFSKNISMLMPGDICFSTSNHGGEGKPTHSYIFMGWVKEGNMEYAYICDNQVSDHGSVYHIRNIKNPTPDKEAFYYFMYKPTDTDNIN